MLYIDRYDEQYDERQIILAGIINFFRYEYTYWLAESWLKHESRSRVQTVGPIATCDACLTGDVSRQKYCYVPDTEPTAVTLGHNVPSTPGVLLTTTEVVDINREQSSTVNDERYCIRYPAYCQSQRHPVC